jgi:hypothetical protein
LIQSIDSCKVAKVPRPQTPIRTTLAKISAGTDRIKSNERRPKLAVGTEGTDSFQ